MSGFPARTNPFASAPPTQRRWISRRDWQDIRRATKRLQVDGVYAVTVHGVKVEFDKNHLKQVNAAAEPRAAAKTGDNAEASKPRRRRAGQLQRDAHRQRHHREAQQQQQRQAPPQQQQQQVEQQQPLPPPTLQHQRQQMRESQLLPSQSDHMDDERASFKRGAVSPAHGSTPTAPRVKRTLSLAPPPPSLPPSPPSTPSRTAQREGALGSSDRTAAKVGLDQTNPQTKCTQARAPSDTSLRCTLCLRDFPWLYNETDARCRTCDAFDKHVRRSEPAPPLLMPGGRVGLHSLTRADLNGRKGTILEFVPGKERWAVRVDGLGGDGRILLKGENLACVPPLRRGGDSSDSDTSSD